VNPNCYNADLISDSYKSPKQPVDRKHYGNEHLALTVFSEAFMMTAIQPAYMASHVNRGWNVTVVEMSPKTSLQTSQCY